MKGKERIERSIGRERWQEKGKDWKKFREEVEGEGQGKRKEEKRKEKKRRENK